MTGTLPRLFRRCLRQLGSRITLFTRMVKVLLCRWTCRLPSVWVIDLTLLMITVVLQSLITCRSFRIRRSLVR